MILRRKATGLLVVSAIPFVTLKWEHVDLEHDELRLRDAKTGARAVPVSPAAEQVLTALPRRPDNPWVFPGHVRGTRLPTLNASWQVVRKESPTLCIRREVEA